MTGLRFGYNAGLPDDVETAWGARLIINQDGMTDLVWDRQDWIGTDEDIKVLQDKLNGGILKQSLTILSDMLKSYQLSTRDDREVILWDADGVKVLANPQSSGGYCYVSAFGTDRAQT